MCVEENLGFNHMKSIWGCLARRKGLNYFTFNFQRLTYGRTRHMMHIQVRNILQYHHIFDEGAIKAVDISLMPHIWNDCFLSWYTHSLKASWRGASMHLSNEKCCSTYKCKIWKGRSFGAKVNSLLYHIFHRNELQVADDTTFNTSNQMWIVCLNHH